MNTRFFLKVSRLKDYLPKQKLTMNITFILRKCPFTIQYDYSSKFFCIIRCLPETFYMVLSCPSGPKVLLLRSIFRLGNKKE